MMLQGLLLAALRCTANHCVGVVCRRSCLKKVLTPCFWISFAVCVSVSQATSYDKNDAETAILETRRTVKTIHRYCSVM